MPKKVIHRKKIEMWINSLLIHKVIHIKQKMWIILKIVFFLVDGFFIKFKLLYLFFFTAINFVK
ncbi:MAG: hypothetical protein EAZ85_09080 [Bacteroidetes bacterium]|nr:MAG: hypothetical protein EAZ85_09080 [Bacteroidota bacterium]TAG88798.1 MAG: hypothetical protein EAZ20_07780 [Bacteroidota bacterium]